MDRWHQYLSIQTFLLKYRDNTLQLASPLSEHVIEGKQKKNIRENIQM